MKTYAKRTGFRTWMATGEQPAQPQPQPLPPWETYFRRPSDNQAPGTEAGSQPLSGGEGAPSTPTEPEDE